MPTKYKVLHKRISEHTQLWTNAEKFVKEKGIDGIYSHAIIVAHEYEIIKGVIGIDLCVDIEPLVSSHPAITKNLYNYMLDYIANSVPFKVDRLEARVNDTRLPYMQGLLASVGFKLLEKINRFTKLIT